MNPSGATPKRMACMGFWALMGLGVLMLRPLPAWAQGAAAPKAPAAQKQAAPAAPNPAAVEKARNDVKQLRQQLQTQFQQLRQTMGKLHTAVQQLPESERRALFEEFRKHMAEHGPMGGHGPAGFPQGGPPWFGHGHEAHHHHSRGRHHGCCGCCGGHHHWEGHHGHEGHHSWHHGSGGPGAAAALASINQKLDSLQKQVNELKQEVHSKK